MVKYICAVSLCLPSIASATVGVESSGGSGGSDQAAVNESANQTEGDNSSGQMMSYAMGGIEIALGVSLMSSPPTEAAGAAMIAMGVLSMLQGGAHGDSKGEAASTGNDTNGYGNSSGGSSDPLDVTNPDSLINKDSTLKAAKSNLAKAEKAGLYDSKAGTVKFNGKDIKVSDFSSPESMAAAGIPKGTISDLMSMTADIERKAEAKLEKLKIGALTAAAGFDDGGAGGGKGSSGDASDDAASSLRYGANGVGSAGKAGSERDPSSLAGMQKNYNGEPIGVAADSIFAMMNRRYKAKESQDSFYTDSDLALQK